MTPPITADSFGRAIVALRKAQGISQKDLAASVLREDEAGSISAQYLNDIEHDRRSPTSDHLIRQIATALDTDPDWLFVLAGKIPDDLRAQASDPKQTVRAFKAFRRVLDR